MEKLEITRFLLAGSYTGQRNPFLRLANSHRRWKRGEVLCMFLSHVIVSVMSSAHVEP